MKLRIVAWIDYDLTDDLEERGRVYGTTDSAECAKVDEANDPLEMIAYARERGGKLNHSIVATFDEEG